MARNLLLPQEQILSIRSSSLIKVMAKLAANQNKLHCNQRSANRQLVFGLSEGVQGDSEYQNWRFSSYVDNFSCMYYERWINYERDLYFLDRAYLHIMKGTPDTLYDSEYICLHWDPNEDCNADHFRYKISPHIHIKCADPPIPHSHIPLYYTNATDFLSSIDDIESVLNSCVSILNEQVLQLLIS